MEEKVWTYTDVNPATKYLEQLQREDGFYISGGPKTAQTNTPLGLFDINITTSGITSNWITSMLVSALAPGDILFNGSVFLRITIPGIFPMEVNFVTKTQGINFVVPAGLDISIIFYELQRGKFSTK